MRSSCLVGSLTRSSLSALSNVGHSIRLAFLHSALIVVFPVAHAPVTLYDESNPLQEPFDNKTIFYRSEARTPTLEESVVVRFAFS